jgi:hypothetical protein
MSGPENNPRDDEPVDKEEYEEYEKWRYMDTHKLGTCLRFANGQTCVGCGDEFNGESLEHTAFNCVPCQSIRCKLPEKGKP